MINFKNKSDLRKKLLAMPDIQQKMKILKELSRVKGIENPILGGGYIRELILGGEPHDLDVHFEGRKTGEEAKKIVMRIEKSLDLPSSDWDLTNKQLRGYRSSIDSLRNNVETVTSVGINAQGNILDPTGFGLQDLKQKKLRILPRALMTFTKLRKKYPPPITYPWFALRAVRFMSRHNLKPTPETEDLIRLLSLLWYAVDKKLKIEFLKKLKENIINIDKTVRLLKKYGMENLVDDFRRVKI